jgi:hypothetical protein
MPSTTRVVAEVETLREEIRSLTRQLPADVLTQPGAVGTWSVKDVIAHFAEWDRWNFAQYRAAFDGDPPALDGRRPQYPVEFEQLLPADERNAMIHEASQRRSLDEVLTDFDAVVDGFLAWLRTRRDEDMSAELGLSAPDDNGRILRLKAEVPEVAASMPLAALIAGDDPDRSSAGHWRYHLPDLKAFARSHSI